MFVDVVDPALDRSVDQPDLRVRVEPVGADAPRASYRSESLVGPAAGPREEVARVRLQDVDDGDFVRAARVDGVVLLGLRLRRVHRDVDAGAEHQRRVGIARRIGGRDVETRRKQVVDEQPVRPPEAQAGHRRDHLRHRAPHRQRVHVGELPRLLVRVVGLDDERAVQVAGVPDPRLAAPGARVRLLPRPDESAFAGPLPCSRQRGLHDARSAANRHQLEVRREGAVASRRVACRAPSVNYAGLGKPDTVPSTSLTLRRETDGADSARMIHARRCTTFASLRTGRSGVPRSRSGRRCGTWAPRRRRWWRSRVPNRRRRSRIGSAPWSPPCAAPTSRRLPRSRFRWAGGSSFRASPCASGTARWVCATR